jgi:hypothetical protein
MSFQLARSQIFENNQSMGRKKGHVSQIHSGKNSIDAGP